MDRKLRNLHQLSIKFGKNPTVFQMITLSLIVWNSLLTICEQANYKKISKHLTANNCVYLLFSSILCYWYLYVNFKQFLFSGSSTTATTSTVNPKKNFERRLLKEIFFCQQITPSSVRKCTFNSLTEFKQFQSQEKHKFNFLEREANENPILGNIFVLVKNNCSLISIYLSDSNKSDIVRYLTLRFHSSAFFEVAWSEFQITFSASWNSIYFCPINFLDMGHKHFGMELKNPMPKVTQAT